MLFPFNSGNGNIHRTPTPEGLRKIKIISFKAFIGLKELLKIFKPLKKRIIQHYQKQRIVIDTPINDHQPCAGLYEPSNITNTPDSLFWRWRRVKEWYRYINDPYENIKGHMTT